MGLGCIQKNITVEIFLLSEIQVGKKIVKVCLMVKLLCSVGCCFGKPRRDFIHQQQIAMFTTRCLLAALVLTGSFMVYSNTTFAQPQLRICAMRYNQQTQVRDFVHYNPFTDQITRSEAMPFNSFVFGTSTLSSQSGVYYIQSLNSADQGITRIDADNGTVLGFTPMPSLDFPKEAEFDYQTGELYGIKATQTGTDSSGFFPVYLVEFVRFDPVTSQTTIIDTIREFDNIVVNTSTYNSLTREFIVVGINSAEVERQARIYWIDAVTGRINHRSNPLDVRVGELQFDNNNNRLLGIAATDNFTCFLAEYDSSGTATPISAYRFSGYIVSNTAFDQESSLYVGRFLEQNSNATRTVVINTLTGDVVSNIPSEDATTVINEWEINNERFASLKFGTSSVTEDSEYRLPITVTPHPATGNSVTFQTEKGITSVDVYNSNGIQMYSGQSAVLPTNGLPSGVYNAVIHLEDGTTTRLPVVVIK